jgi:hypothetical protein
MDSKACHSRSQASFRLPFYAWPRDSRLQACNTDEPDLNKKHPKNTPISWNSSTSTSQKYIYSVFYVGSICHILKHSQVGSCFVNLITRNIIVQLDYRNDAPFRNYGHSKFHNPSCMWRKILQPSSPYSCTQWQKACLGLENMLSACVSARVSCVFGAG